jgi:Carbohydrate esterase, sialic acid-specific acetylesterase/Concanavalin A-like lectin/glucanases superfamily
MKQYIRHLLVWCWLAYVGAVQADTSSGYDIFLLAGQSNMAGRAAITSPIDADGQPVATIKMWDPVHGIVPAKDPLIHPETGTRPTGVGMGMSFAKAYSNYLVATGSPNRKVLLVGGAWGGTSFVENVPNLGYRWLVTSNPTVGGDLYRSAVARTNAAIAKAIADEPSSKFKGILWHQGESDLVRGGANGYAAKHKDLMLAFRTQITGGANAPIVVGEMAPCWWSQCGSSVQTVSEADLNTMLNYFHGISTQLPNSAWVSSAGLQSNSAADQIHFNTVSQRELGRRYFSKYWEASQGLAPPMVELRAYGGLLFNVGNTIDFEKSFNAGAPLARSDGNVAVLGNVQIVADALHGSVAKIDNSAGQLRLPIGGSTFNASYTKMAWVKLRSNTYRNHLMSGDNASQAHSLYTSLPSKSYAAGHSTTTNRNNVFVSQSSTAGLNTWTHVAVTYDKASLTMRLFVNGALVDTQGAVPTATQATGVTYLNMSGFGSRVDYGLDGQMSGNKAYATSLSASQIQAIFKFERNSQRGYGRQ